jgi:hypothetical protein
LNKKGSIHESCKIHVIYLFLNENLKKINGELKGEALAAEQGVGSRKAEGRERGTGSSEHGNSCISHGART